MNLSEGLVTFQWVTPCISKSSEIVDVLLLLNGKVRVVILMRTVEYTPAVFSPNVDIFRSVQLLILNARHNEGVIV